MRVLIWFVGGALLLATPLVSCSNGGSGTDGGATAPDLSQGVAPCSLASACTAIDKACVGLTSNAGQSRFGLRMAELVLTSPAPLTAGSGTLGQSLAGDVGLNLPSCNQSAMATFSWLLQF